MQNNPLVVIAGFIFTFWLLFKLFKPGTKEADQSSYRIGNSTLKGDGNKTFVVFAGWFGLLFIIWLLGQLF